MILQAAVGWKARSQVGPRDAISDMRLKSVIVAIMGILMMAWPAFSQGYAGGGYSTAVDRDRHTLIDWVIGAGILISLPLSVFILMFLARILKEAADWISPSRKLKRLGGLVTFVKLDLLLKRLPAKTLLSHVSASNSPRELLVLIATYSKHIHSESDLTEAIRILNPWAENPESPILPHLMDTYIAQSDRIKERIQAITRLHELSRSG